MNETFKTINDWAQETFNGGVELHRGVERADEEFDELYEAVFVGKSLEDTAMEIADVIIVLSHTAESNGIDLQKAIDKKMSINRARNWKLNDDGTAQHVRS